MLKAILIVGTVGMMVLVGGIGVTQPDGCQLVRVPNPLRPSETILQCAADEGSVQAPTAAVPGGDGDDGTDGDGSGWIPTEIEPGDDNLGECNWRAALLPAGNPAWEGRSSADGILQVNFCNAQGEAEYRFVPNNTAPPPPNPVDLAQQAISQMEIPRPAASFGPDDQLLAVKYPVWLWITGVEPRTLSVTAGAVTVTATAELVSTTWDMGEPLDIADPRIKPEPLTCLGAGEPPPPGIDEREMPDCGYIYNWKSLPERTDGVGKWPVTTTANWEVSWTSNMGVSDVIEVQTSSATAVAIGEWDVVIVPGPRR